MLLIIGYLGAAVAVAWAVFAVTRSPLKSFALTAALAILACSGTLVAAVVGYVMATESVGGWPPIEVVVGNESDWDAANRRALVTADADGPSAFGDELREALDASGRARLVEWAAHAPGLGHPADPTEIVWKAWLAGELRLVPEPPFLAALRIVARSAPGESLELVRALAPHGPSV